MSTYLYWGKDKILTKEIFEEIVNIFVIKVWCEIGVKYKQETLCPLKGSAKSATKAFRDAMNKVISIFSTLSSVFFIISFKRI